MMSEAVRQSVDEEGRRMRRVLSANAWFSLLSGAALVGGAVLVDDALGVSPWILVGVGAALVPYGMVLRRAAQPGVPDRRLVAVATAADLAWVAGAAVVVAVPGAMTGLGKAALAILTIVVLDFAALQLVGLRRGWAHASG